MQQERKTSRVPLGVSGRLQGVTGSTECAVVNISLGGACLHVNHRLPIGEEVQVQFMIGATTLQLPGVVRWYDARLDNGNMGIQWGSLRANEALTLSKFTAEAND